MPVFRCFRPAVGNFRAETGSLETVSTIGASPINPMLSFVTFDDQALKKLVTKILHNSAANNG